MDSPHATAPDGALFEQVETHKIYVKVIEQVLNLVRSGTLKRGDQLPSENELTVQLGVSRPSVREALRALEVVGIVESRTGVGRFVTRDTPRESMFGVLNELAEEGGPSEIMETRLAVEPTTAFLAAQRRTEEQLRQMDELLHLHSEQVRAGEDTIDCDLQFHLLIASAAGNQVLEDCMRLIAGRMQHRFWQAIKTANLSIPGRAKTYLEQHRQIRDAISNRDAEGASAAMRLHLGTVHAGFHEQAVD
jgi:GntR family transcriptional repressor for pyruvate dehydrogenase complex